MHILLRFIILFIKCLFDIIGDIFYFFGFKISPLTVENISKDISKEARSELLQYQYLRENLEVLLRNFTYGNTVPVTGRYFSKIWLNQLLELRVQIKRYLKEDPTVYKVPFRRPVFFVTMMRTGSTFLHCLMSQDDQWKCPKLWEMEDFCPPPGVNKKIDETKLAHSKLKYGK